MDDYIHCEGCGERIDLGGSRRERPMQMREQAHNPAPGRVTVLYRGTVIHKCADGTFVPPDRVAPQKSS